MSPTFQQLSLKNLSDGLNRPMRDLRISVMDRCNFRCPYCMPKQSYPDNHPFIPTKNRMTFGEITRLASLFTGLGVNKIRLTGGEPLLRKNIHELIEMLVSTDGVDDLALTTNGFLLAKQAKSLVAAGLQRVTVSLDSTNREIFSAMSGDYDALDAVLEGIVVADKHGLSPIKINVVVQKEKNDQDIIKLLEFFRGTGHIVRFIEFMDVGNQNQWNRSQVVSSAELLKIIHAKWPLEAKSPHYRGEVARRHRFIDGGGEIGFISSVSKPFCGDCTRARLSSDGRLYTCLFAAEGLDLLGPIRVGATDTEIVHLIRNCWSSRQDRYSELRGGSTQKKKNLKKIEMYQIGG